MALIRVTFFHTNWLRPVGGLDAVSKTTAYTFLRTQTLSPDVAARKAARKKVIERAQRIERESYKALMRRKRQLQASSIVDTIV